MTRLALLLAGFAAGWLLAVNRTRPEEPAPWGEPESHDACVATIGHALTCPRNGAWRDAIEADYV